MYAFQYVTIIMVIGMRTYILFTESINALALNVTQ